MFWVASRRHQLIPDCAILWTDAPSWHRKRVRRRRIDDSGRAHRILHCSVLGPSKGKVLRFAEDDVTRPVVPC